MVLLNRRATSGLPMKPSAVAGGWFITVPGAVSAIAISFWFRGEPFAPAEVLKLAESGQQKRVGLSANPCGRMNCNYFMPLRKLLRKPSLTLTRRAFQPFCFYDVFRPAAHSRSANESAGRKTIHNLCKNLI